MQQNLEVLKHGRTTDPVRALHGQARLPRVLRPRHRGGRYPAQIRQEDGCLAYDYYFSAQDENEVLLIERWESAAHQRVHMEQPHMARLREIKDKYIAATKLGRVHLED